MKRVVADLTPSLQVLGGIVSMLGLIVVVGLVLGEDTDPSIDKQMLAQCVAGVVPLAVALFWPLGVSWLGRRGRPGLHLLGAYVLFMAAWVPIAFFAYPWFLDALGCPLEMQPHLEYFTAGSGQTGFWLTLVTVCVVGPIYEEIVFRGFFQSGLRRWIGFVPSLIIVSVMFGLIHSVKLAFPLTLVGAFFGYIRERDDGMLSPILVHVLHNSVTVGLVVGYPELMSEVYSK